jgi:hypothetical protein
MIKNHENLTNTFLITSEFPQCGELLAYYYYHKYPLFEKAVIIHDSTFINKFIPEFYVTKDVQFLWDFEHHWDNVEEEMKCIYQLDNYGELTDIYNDKSNWKGCFGVQSVITYEFLDKIQKKHNILRLTEKIKCRNDRYHIERVFGLVCCRHSVNALKSLLGNIHAYQRWGYTFDEYKADKNTEKNKHCSVVKTWAER